jgi:hypothetical protein
MAEREGLAVDNCPKHRLYLDQTPSTTVRARAKREAPNDL